jgi:hypothetical protein
VRDPDQRILESERIDDLGGRREQRDDPHDTIVPDRGGVGQPST